MTSIKTKLLPVIILGVILLASIFYFFSVRTQEKNLEKITLDGIIKSRNTFENLQQDDIKMLKMGINNLLSNEKIYNLFIEGNREDICKELEPTFLKSKDLGQSVYQFNVYEKDKVNSNVVFLRVHNPKKFGDAVTRTANNLARETKQWGYGIDLGNSGFALRVVAPILNDNNDVIGDIEFGEEMNHFLTLMKKQTGHDYSMVVDKSKVTADGWKKYTESKSLRNNYDDLRSKLVIDSTLDARQIDQKCLDELNLNNAPMEGTIFSKYIQDGKTFVCGGFSFNDVNDQKVGTIVVIEDVTALDQNAKQNNQIVLIIAIISAIVIGGIMVFLVSKLIITPIENVVNVATRVAGGDFDAKININSDDEIGQLANTMEQFKLMMVNTAKDLEKSHKKKK